MKKTKMTKNCGMKKGGKVSPKKSMAKTKKPEMKAEGETPKARLDKPGFKRGGAVKKSKTQVNVIVQQPDSGPKLADMAAMPGKAPLAPPPAMATPTPPPGLAPLKPPGMKTGGVVGMSAGAGSGVGRLQKAEKAKK